MDNENAIENQKLTNQTNLKQASTFAYFTWIGKIKANIFLKTVSQNVSE